MKSLHVLLLFIMFSCFGCSDSDSDPDAGTDPDVDPPENEVVDLKPTWQAGEPVFVNGPEGTFDEVAVKDPSIVYHEGQYHLFYTGRDNNFWRLGYATAPTLPGFTNASHQFLNSLNAGTYFAAPQVFYFRAKGLWYLIYQSGLGATFSTNDDIADPDGWSTSQSMGFGDGIDFWCISDLTYVYCFYSAQDGSRTIKRRRTSVTEFPFGWGEPEVVAQNTFEAVHVYRNKGDGKYYMIVEDISRHQELWMADDLGGVWTKLEEQWAHSGNLNQPENRWTDQVSHAELIRSGNNEMLEVESLNQCRMIFQGVLDGNYGDYSRIPYDLGVAQNY